MVDDSVLDCCIVGKFWFEGQKIINFVVVGDRVEVECSEKEDNGIIWNILFCCNYVVWQLFCCCYDFYFLASNIDQAIVIMIIIQLDFKQGFIDWFLLMMEFYEIFVIIVFNKVDFYDIGYVGVFEYLCDIYGYIGY